MTTKSGWRGGSAPKTIAALPEVLPGFHSQHVHAACQPAVIPDSGPLMPSSDLCGNCMHVVHVPTCRQNNSYIINEKRKRLLQLFFSVTPLPSETYITYNKMFFKTPEDNESFYFLFILLSYYISLLKFPSFLLPIHTSHLSSDPLLIQKRTGLPGKPTHYHTTGLSLFPVWRSGCPPRNWS